MRRAAIHIASFVAASGEIYDYSPSGASRDKVAISNFRWIAVASADGSLAAHRAARATPPR